MLALRRHLVVAFGASLVVGCTALVQFDEQPFDPCDGGDCIEAASHDALPPQDVAEAARVDAAVCATLADGTACGLNDACHDAPTCAAGLCVLHAKADNTPCAAPSDACHSTPVCTKGVCGASAVFPEGYNWKPGDDTARCCHGAPVHTNTVTNCGVCDVGCDTTKGQSCSQVGGHWFCAPCGPNTDCWSGCCSMTTAPHCAPSDCATGTCNPTVCRDGSHCQSDTVNYCSY